MDERRLYGNFFLISCSIITYWYYILILILMPQSHAIVAALKKALKANSLTYWDVAKQLGLSEASVKRLFATSHFSLTRLDSICQMLGLEISDIASMAEAESKKVHQLSHEQELELVSDIRLLLVSFLVLNRWNFEDIVSHYELTQNQLVRYLAKLDKLKLVELLPHNKIKLRVSPHFSWRKNGPIQKFFTSKLQDDFLASRFDNKNESLIFLAGMLSRTSIEKMLDKLKQLSDDFNELNQKDSQRPLEQRTGHSLLLAIRPWRPDVFDKFSR